MENTFFWMLHMSRKIYDCHPVQWAITGKYLGDRIWILYCRIYIAYGKVIGGTINLSLSFSAHNHIDIVI